jgi:sterol desaturase/sphingolipid hydroxylase (fatty acid hydroxylase superfamily)
MAPTIGEDAKIRPHCESTNISFRGRVMIQRDWLLPAIVTTIYLMLFVVERFVPLRARTRLLRQRVLVNVAITALALAIAAITVRPAVAHVFALSPELGLLALLDLPLVFEFAIAFLLFDWSFYWWHRANHRFPLLWRFHNVHHVDPDLDVTTAFRFHAVEIAYSAAFRVVQLVLIGPMVWMYFLYELSFQVSTAFHHSNVKLPLRIERTLNFVFVTPRMHGIHHSYFHNETDSNYSTVFSWWDRLHRSLRLNVRQQEVEIGVPAYSMPDDNRVGRLLSMPFRRQRPYWQRLNGNRMEARATLQTATPETLQE